MQIDDQLISRLEKLARLRLSSEEREKLKGDLGSILDMVEKLKELDTEGVEPLEYIFDEENILREDEVKNQLPREKAFENAPKHDEQFFKVPKVIDK